MNSSFLKEKRIEAGLSQSAIGQMLGYSTQTISLWESGKGEPSLIIWGKYASILNIDLEGLLLARKTHNNNFCNDKQFDVEEFAKYLRALRKKKGITQAALAKVINAPTNTIIRFEKGVSVPDSKQFVILCNYYHITFDDLYFCLSEMPKPLPLYKKKWFIPIFVPIVVVLTIGGGATTGIVLTAKTQRNSRNIYSSIVNSDNTDSTSNSGTSISLNSSGGSSSSSGEHELIVGAIQYGLYPQTHITDQTLIEQLDLLSPINEYECYEYENEYYEKRTPEFDPGGIDSGYYFDNDEKILNTKNYWFKYEPIQWDIYEENDDNYTLISTQLLDSSKYRYGETSNNYKDSDLRAFLNGEFFNKAFFLETKKPLITEVDNSLESTIQKVNHYVCENTFDQVYAPSAAELTGIPFESRKKVTTEYARTKHIYVNSDFSSIYWSRSPFNDDSKNVYAINADGGLSKISIQARAKQAIRPMIKIAKS